MNFISKMAGGLSGILFALCLLMPGARADGVSKPDIGTVVIDHVPAATRSYVGSPSIVIMPDGTYVASHDYFGGGSSSDTTDIFNSNDRGLTWRKTATIKGQWWSTLFVHQGQLYILGVSRSFGQIVIRRSTDGGTTWTTPASAATGQLTSEKGYHDAPTPVIEYNGRLWRAFEDNRRKADASKSFRALVISAPTNVDLLMATNWTFSSGALGSNDWLGGKFDGWLEGNAVVDPDGRMLDILRVRFTAGPEKAAFVQISGDGSTATFDPATGFHDFPGGAKKFTIRFDPQTKFYWTLANTVPEPKPPGPVDLIRNTLALESTPDLIHWTERAVVLHHPDAKKHAFQYVDWQFDGDDIVAASRTANDDDSGGANSGHNANYLTFSRIPNFRELKESLPVSAPGFETRDYSITGSGFAIETFANGKTAFANRKYVWEGIPDKFSGWHYTQSAGGAHPRITVRAKRNATVQIITAINQSGIDLSGWQQSGDVFSYNDAHHSRMMIYSKNVVAGEEIQIPEGNWTGGLLLFSE